MPLNSVITNISANVALQSLNRTTDALQTAQKKISTGYRVADAKDDGAAFAVAERIRGDMASTTSANQQLGGVKGLLDVTNSALENISGTLKDLKAIVVKLADQSINNEQRSQYQEQARSLTNNIRAYIEDATYNGRNILDEGAGTAVYVSLSKVPRSGDGTYYSFAGYSGMASIWNLVSGAYSWGGATAQANLSAATALGGAIANVLTQMNNFGSYSNYIESQISYNNAVMDAQSSGLGALIDADLAKESAQLQALQIRQQLGTQALGIANQSPQILLSLFRG